MSTTRKAPSESATLFKKGTIKKGNDGNRWVIVTNTRGVQRWQKVQVVVKKRTSHESLVNPESHANLEKSVSLEKRASLVVVHVGEFRIVLGCFGLSWNEN